MDSKVCAKCQLERPVNEFYIDGRSGLPRPQCKQCMREPNRTRAADRYRNDPTVQARAATRYRSNREELIAYSRADHARIRARAIQLYGGTCVRCGSTENLQFDHVKSDGAEHRSVEDHRSMQRRIVRLGGPLPDVDLQLLCHPHHVEKTTNHRRSLRGVTAP